MATLENQNNLKQIKQDFKNLWRQKNLKDFEKFIHTNFI